MSGDRPTVISWDSCIFLAWFKQEEDKPLSEIEFLLKEIAAGRQVLIVSTICCAEVLDEASRSDAGAQFRDFVKRRNVMAANVDMRIAELAAVFRQRLRDAVHAGEINRGLRAPDALIAATAVIYKASVLHTFDPELLNLSESALLDGLLIAAPSPADRRPPETA